MSTKLISNLPRFFVRRGNNFLISSERRIIGRLPLSTVNNEGPEGAAASNGNSTSSSSNGNKSSSSIDDIKERILEHSLKYVPEHGWSDKAIFSGSQDLGYSGMSSELFPNSGGDLIAYFDRKCNEKLNNTMAEWTATRAEGHFSITQFINNAVKHRLLLTAEFIDKWPQAMAIKAMPQNIPTSLRNLYFIVDDIWHYAGDKSTDLNWYSKRGLLAGVYKTTELRLLTDGSPDYEQTWEFLSRRLAGVATFGKNLRNVSQGFEKADEILSAVRTMTLNIIGISRKR